MSHTHERAAKSIRLGRPDIQGEITEMRRELLCLSSLLRPDDQEEIEHLFYDSLAGTGPHHGLPDFTY
jgi:hypothetical protein